MELAFRAMVTYHRWRPPHTMLLEENKGFLPEPTGSVMAEFSYDHEPDLMEIQIDADRAAGHKTAIENVTITKQ